MEICPFDKYFVVKKTVVQLPSADCVVEGRGGVGQGRRWSDIGYRYVGDCHIP